MTEFFLVCVYVGGLHPAYCKSRGLGNGRVEAFFDAWLWPLGIGRFLIRFWEDA